MSAAQIQTYMAAAAAAMASRDYDTALDNAYAAQALLAGTPDLRSGGDDGRDIEWDREAIDKFVARARSEQTAAAVAATGGIKRTKITYAETSG